MSTPTVALDTPIRFYEDRDCVAYVALGSTTGVNAVIEMGPTEALVDTVEIAATIPATGGVTATVLVPAGWWISVPTSGDLAVEVVTVITN